MWKLVKTALYIQLPLLLIIYLCTKSRAACDFYALELYPIISCFLSSLASIFPFSLQELSVLFFVFLLIAIIPFAIKRKFSFGKIIVSESALISFVVIWFYFSWGLNYFRSDIFSRTGTEETICEAGDFKSFLEDYTKRLNASYVIGYIDKNFAESEIKNFYDKLPEKYGLARPKRFHRPKAVLFNPLYSSVGVMGYIGPAFVEMHINKDVPYIQYPFVYAHEYSHILGISEEAEANFWAYRACLESSDPILNYMARLGIFEDVRANASRLLDKEGYDAWLSSVRPEILEEIKNIRGFWESKKRKKLSKAQKKVYNTYLKGNNIRSGIKNYSESVSIIMTFRDIAL